VNDAILGEAFDFCFPDERPLDVSVPVVGGGGRDQKQRHECSLEFHIIPTILYSAQADHQQVFLGRRDGEQLLVGTSANECRCSLRLSPWRA
jgi:hypothetical protein